MSMLEPLRHKAFRYLAAGRVVNMLGNAVAPIALAFAVLDLTGSVRDLGLVVGARSLANVVFILFGGVIADRLPRQVVMVWSCVLAALSQGAVATLVLTGDATVVWLAILGAVNGVVSAFAFPATSALLAQTVPGHIRKQANAVNRLGINAAMIAGASVGGLLVAGFGPGWGLVVDASTFALSAVLFGLVRVPDYRAERTQGSNILSELREGWTEFVANTWVWVVVLAFTFFNLAEVAGLSVLGPTAANETFGRTIWGFVLAAQTAGMLVGGLIALRLKVRRLLLLGAAACVGPAFLLGAVSLSGDTVILIAGGFVSGVCLEQFGIAWETSLQEHIPADKLARVYSYDALGSFVAIPIGQVAAGPLALLVGFRTALLICCAVIVVSTLGMLLSRSVRSLEHHPKALAPTENDPVVAPAVA
jgi:MFS family permease